MRRNSVEGRGAFGLLSVAAALVASGCGEIKVAASAGGAAGESCTKTADCKSGLGCVANVCTNTTGADGATDQGDGGTDQGDGGTDQGDGGTDQGDGATDQGSGGNDPCGVGECAEGNAGDGVCVKECNCEAASYDGGDCSNACTSEGMRAVWQQENFEYEPGKCWDGCAGDGDLVACTSSCLQSLGLDEPCGGCFAAYIDCTASACGAPCVNTPSDATCDECASANCWQAFYNCSGAL